MFVFCSSCHVSYPSLLTLILLTSCLTAYPKAMVIYIFTTYNRGWKSNCATILMLWSSSIPGHCLHLSSLLFRKEQSIPESALSEMMIIWPLLRKERARLCPYILPVPSYSFLNVWYMFVSNVLKTSKWIIAWKKYKTIDIWGARHYIEFTFFLYWTHFLFVTKLHQILPLFMCACICMLFLVVTSFCWQSRP